MATEGQEIMVFCTASFRDWSKLPIDLLADILIRLPDSGLVRCKVVCKSWNDTIVNICIPKAFACAHLSELISTNGRFWIVTHVPHHATRGDIGSSFENLYRAFPSVPMSRNFCGCCNGLFLLSETCFFCVYNPATGQRVEIPTFHEASQRCYVSLAFDPSRSPHFKVVCYRVIMYTFKFYIYSSETGRWDVHKHKYDVERGRFGKSVYVNGILYCLSAQRNILLGVDVDNPKVCSIKLPWNIKASVTGFIGESRNHLCYSNRDFFYMFVWRLEGYLDAPKWVLMHKIRIKSLIPIVGKEYRDSFTLYALDPNSDVIFIGTPRAIVAYDPHGRKVLRTHWAKYDNSDVSLVGGQYCTYPYIRCLVSLKSHEYCTSSLSRHVENATYVDKLEQKLELALLRRLLIKHHFLQPHESLKENDSFLSISVVRLQSRTDGFRTTRTMLFCVKVEEPFRRAGVVYNSEEPCRRACVDVFAEMGVDVTVDDFVPIMGTGEANFLGGVASPKRVQGFDINAAKKIFFEIYLEKYAKPNSGIRFPGSLELIKQV